MGEGNCSKGAGKGALSRESPPRRDTEALSRLPAGRLNSRTRTMYILVSKIYKVFLVIFITKGQTSEADEKACFTDWLPDVRGGPRYSAQGRGEAVARGADHE